MARISVERDAAKNLVVFSVDGELRADDMVEHYRRAMADTPADNLIWDMTSAELGSLGVPDLKSVADAVAEVGPVRTAPKTAFVVDRFEQGVLLKLYRDISTLSGIPTDFRLVETREEALAWFDGKT